VFTPDDEQTIDPMQHAVSAAGAVPPAWYKGRAAPSQRQRGGIET
jgi:hypothetical protein